MWDKVKAWYLVVHGTFHDSEVILWARVQVALGVVAGVLVSTDLSTLFDNPKVLTGYLLLNGLATEMLRRNRSAVQPDGSFGDDEAPRGKAI